MLESSACEAIESKELEDLHAAATAELQSTLGLECKFIGPARVSIAAVLPASAIVINRTIGLGLETAAKREQLQQVLSAYRQAGVQTYFIHRHPAAQPPELADWLLESGLEKARGWQKFSRGREPVPDLSTELRLAEIGPAFGEAFARIACDAFELGDAAIPWLARLPGRQGWRVFMSYAGDEPAGVGALFIHGEYAWTDFGATAPRYRQLGSQAALLARRVQCAIDCGCREIFTCTGEAVPGDPQHSYRNILRLGFKEFYIRENYAPPRPQ